MEISTILMLALILAVALPAVWIDTRERRIPNILVLVTLALGVLFQLWAQGPNGGIAALAGVAVGTFFFLPFHVFGAMGAGDVKFMGALGAALGPLGALVAGALALIAGAVLGVAAFFWMQWRRTTSAADSSAHVAPPPVTTLPYAAAIAAGSLGAVWWLAA